MKLALFRCSKDVIVYGRNEDGTPDKCFIEGKEYLFCYDTKKANVFIINEVGEYDISNINYMDKEFELIKIGTIDEFELDEVSKHRLKRLYKDRISYEEED